MTKTSIKLISITLFVMCCFENIQSQDTKNNKINSIIIESGYAFTGTGDMHGSFIATEYGRYIISKVKISGRIENMNFLSQENSLLQSSSLIGVGIHGYYDIMDLKRLKFQIGTGILHRNWKWVYATGENSSFRNSDGFSLSPSSFDSYTNNTFGYSISIGSIININETFGISVRGLYQNDTKGDNTVSARIGINFRF